MTDLEMTKLCAEAMGYELCPRHDSAGLLAIYEDVVQRNCDEWNYYDPLNEDAQAMALVKAFGLRVWKDEFETCPEWSVCLFGTHDDAGIFRNHSLNRAIVECVAKMQEAKNGTA